MSEKKKIITSVDPAKTGDANASQSGSDSLVREAVTGILNHKKKYCPMCFWTGETTDTHCPMVGLTPWVHNYNLSVPLEICGPDTTSEHKYAKRRHVVTGELPAEDILNGKKVPIRVDHIRMLQKKARREGKIRDGNFS
jgi:hypothetical protein